MAIGFLAAGAGLRRNAGAFLNGNANFTIMYWIMPGVVGSYRTYHFLSTAGGAPYLGNFSTPDQDMAISYDDGGGNVNSATFLLIQEDAYHIAYTYNNTAKTLKIYINRSLVETLTGVDFSGATFSLEELGYDGFSDPALALQNYRSYQRELTAAEIAAG